MSLKIFPFGREEKLWKKLDHTTSDSTFPLLFQNNSIKVNFLSKDCNATLLNLNSLFPQKTHFGNTPYVKQTSTGSGGQICSRILYGMQMWSQDFNFTTAILPKIYCTLWFFGSCNVNRSWLGFPLAWLSQRKALSSKNCFVCFGLTYLHTGQQSCCLKWTDPEDWGRGLGCWLRNGNQGPSWRSHRPKMLALWGSWLHWLRDW